jgi:hypothetical protein
MKMIYPEFLCEVEEVGTGSRQARMLWAFRRGSRGTSDEGANHEHGIAATHVRFQPLSR